MGSWRTWKKVWQSLKVEVLETTFAANGPVALMGALAMNIPKSLRAIALELRAFRERARAADSPACAQEVAYAAKYRQVHGVEPPADGFGLIGCEGAFRLNNQRTALRDAQEAQHMVCLYSMSLDIPQGPNRQEIEEMSSFTESKIKTSAAAQERSWTVMESQVAGAVVQVCNYLRANGFQTGAGDAAAIAEMFSVADGAELDGQGLAELLAANQSINLAWWNGNKNFVALDHVLRIWDLAHVSNDPKVWNHHF